MGKKKKLLANTYYDSQMYIKRKITDDKSKQ